MKKYSTEIAAQRLISENLALGSSRHLSDKKTMKVITGVGTARNYQSGLKLAGDWLLDSKGKHLQNMNRDDACEYLTLRALTVGQSAVDLARQAINMHFFQNDPIPFFPSTKIRVLKNRAYCDQQIALLLMKANPSLSLSIRLAHYAGLRAFELITLAPQNMLNESQRDAWCDERFMGREGDDIYIVHGKGGLCRRVMLSRSLSEELMTHLREHPIKVKDRKVIHTSFFNLLGGVNFSTQFSKLSKEVLGKSYGAHGLRHSYVQSRVRDLICRGLSYEQALQAVSNEVGHFDTANTEAYLRI